jgi:hypothetical protein
MNNVPPDKTIEQIILDEVVRRLIKYDGHRESVAKSLGVCIRTLRNIMNRNLEHPVIKMFKSREFQSRIKSVDFWIPRE